jgi:glyoxylase I family protein
MPLSVHHLAVRVADLDRAEAFYAGLLGLTVTRRLDDAAGRPRAVWLALGAGAFLALELAPERVRAPEGGPSFHCVALGIDRAERAAWRGRLAAAGHPVVHETEFTIYARDPDDNLVGLSHHPEPALPEAG